MKTFLGHHLKRLHGKCFQLEVMPSERSPQRTGTNCNANVTVWCLKWCLCRVKCCLVFQWTRQSLWRERAFRTLIVFWHFSCLFICNSFGVSPIKGKPNSSDLCTSLNVKSFWRKLVSRHCYVILISMTKGFCLLQNVCVGDLKIWAQRLSYFQGRQIFT